MPLTQEEVLAALSKVNDPRSRRDIVSIKAVREIAFDGDQVGVRLAMPYPSPEMKQVIEEQIRNALDLAGARQVLIEWLPEREQEEHGHAPPAAPSKSALPQVRHVIAVGAGKGGVGKSTVSVNLAIGLQRSGFRVGLMDGDIYGPSAPTLLGIKGLEPQLAGKKIAPFHVHGIHAVTIGALVPADKPLIWRGPMAHGAFKQLLLDHTAWPELDYLIVDLPPGTGDVPLTLCQLLPLTGVVLVATPQQVALDDAIRALGMFRQLEAPILGMVENMSYFVGPDGRIADIFGRGGAQRAAQELGIPFLGAIPLFTELRVNSDAGTPRKNFESNKELEQSLMAVTNALLQQVKVRELEVEGPEITIV